VNTLTGFGGEPERFVVTARGGERAPHETQSIFNYFRQVAHEIAALRQATPADLRKRWRALYCTEPPRRISRDLLVRALAYRIQEKALGGLKPSTRRLLAKVGPPLRRRTGRCAWHINRLSNREQCCYASGTAPSIR